jgi:RHH-type transcriptional regulator, proline utilization regulon repressor / proline dehydrogenase / delta 1-pyrroline-5-carboxylate dehydrogenase
MQPTDTASSIDGRTAPEGPPRDEIAARHLMAETGLVDHLMKGATFTAEERARIARLAAQLVRGARANRHKHGGIDAFMAEYGLSSDEGVILLCLAEALLRIPDKDTVDALIAEKIGSGHWMRHLGASDSLLVNASTFGLMVTGGVVRLGQDKGSGPAAVLKRLVSRSGEPVIRQALRQAMRILGDSFVLGETIEEALVRAAPLEAKGYRFSYDMLGERARTAADADIYFGRYMAAADAVGRAHSAGGVMRPHELLARPGLSVKLSALHPRFDPGKEERLLGEMLPRLIELAVAARRNGLMLTIDAEEQDRLDPTLTLFAAAFCDPALEGWPGLGIVVQAYGKRAVPVLRWLRRLAHAEGKPIPVRLVKGAYWDSEIKWAQERGLADYPVLTRKVHTDLSWIACMRLLLSDTTAFVPQFATHNAMSIAAVAVVAPSAEAYEFQRLHGMGEAIYDEVTGEGRLGAACRIYAPVGPHKDLVAYLVRRLLENGANTSFVNRLADAAASIEAIVRDPLEVVQEERESRIAPPRLPRPPEIFLPQRTNSLGLALDQPEVRRSLLTDIAVELRAPFAAVPIVNGKPLAGDDPGQLVRCPHDRRQRIGTVHAADAAAVDQAIAGAQKVAHAWDMLGGEARAAILERAADLYERDRVRLMAVIVREAGKTLENALGDVREAIDFLRYYAGEARRLFAGPTNLKGPTGETSTLQLRGRGPFACISPWNFPLAIFTGQVAAALAAGNPVLAKPAEQTPIVAFLATQLLTEAGLPPGVLQLLPGDGAVGALLVKDPRVAGVAFTGSNATGWAIQSALAERRGAMVPLIAETGGLNAMIADSSALPEQAIRDVVRSAFDSAGQRCSAARLFFVQEDAAGPMIDMLVGAVEALDVGDPLDYATDIGPVIDEEAAERLDAHKLRMQKLGRQLVDLDLPPECDAGTYVTPAVFEIADAGLLKEEVFGPILHVVRFQAGHLDEVLAAINASGYGLTLGVHSRIAAVADYVAEHARVGNLYVNRNQIGAVVGVQPFGGEGLSGTGPKAGGPNYLARFATERVRTTDITATGGNVALLGLEES